MTGVALHNGTAALRINAERDGRARDNGVRGGRPRKAARRPVKLTLRGRIMVALMIGLMAWAGWNVVAPVQAQSAPGATQVVNYTVRPGDTLWSYAESITPQGDDVSATVSELVKLNNLDSATLWPGQRIIVPAR